LFQGIADLDLIYGFDRHFRVLCFFWVAFAIQVVYVGSYYSLGVAALYATS
jgi:hypothetical protein